MIGYSSLCNEQVRKLTSQEGNKIMQHEFWLQFMLQNLNR